MSSPKTKPARRKSPDLDHTRALPEKALAVLAAQLMRQGRMPQPGVLADALATGHRASRHLHSTVRAKLARAPEVAPYNKLMVSSSQREGSTVDHARVGLHGPDFAALVAETTKHPDAAGGENGFGFWSDGAEESRIVNVPDASKLPKVAAALGKRFRQKGVIHFTSDPSGPDVAHVVTIRGHADPASIAEAALRRGVVFKTIVPRDGGATVHVLDEGGEHAGNVAAFAKDYAAEHRQHRGKVTFLGGDTRDDADKEYDRVLSQ